jgi:hypothetical protein
VAVPNDVLVQLERALDKLKFRESTAKLITDGVIQVGVTTPDKTICATRIENWRPEDNEFWDIPDNKSYPRNDVVCSTCQCRVVLSDGMYRSYKAMPVKSPVLCDVCFKVIVINPLQTEAANDGDRRD